MDCLRHLCGVGRGIRAVEVEGGCPNFVPIKQTLRSRLHRVERGPLWTFMYWWSLLCWRPAKNTPRSIALTTRLRIASSTRARGEGSAERYKVKFECRALKSYGLLMSSPKA